MEPFGLRSKRCVVPESCMWLREPPGAKSLDGHCHLVGKRTLGLATFINVVVVNRIERFGIC